MKSILIILGWAAGQLQEQSTASLDIANLYDIDARHLRGPITVHYQVRKAVIDLPNVSLASLSFIGGILVSATVNPHERPLEAGEAAQLCRTLYETISRRGLAFDPAEVIEFDKFVEELKVGRVPDDVLPPWRFGGKLEGDAVTFVIRPFERLSTPSTRSDKKFYVIALEIGNSRIADVANESLDHARSKTFPTRNGRIRLSEYPKR